MKQAKKPPFVWCYLLWALSSVALVYWAVLCHGLSGLSVLLVLGWVMPLALAVLYRPLKRLFSQRRRAGRAALLCAAVLLPLAGTAWLRLVPFCGLGEMRRMVAEGTAYFEEHREELEQRAAASPTLYYWRTDSSDYDSYCALRYTQDGTRRGGFRQIPLDDHWWLMISDDGFWDPR